jgi:DNA-binding transcriptional LysR family regulator
MDSQLLKTFLNLYETRNFTATAKRMHRSQAAISLQLNRLEELLGKQLFYRDQRNVAPTEDAEQLLTYARRILRLENELIEFFQNPTISGSIKFGAPEDIATTYLPKILAKFSASHPGVSINFSSQFTIDLIQNYEAGNYDLVLIKQDPRHPHVKSQEIWREPLVWVSAKKPLPDEEPINLILAPPPCVYRKRALESLDHANIESKIVYTSPSIAGVIAALKAGLGVAVLPVNMVPKGLYILSHLPKLKDAQIALLKRENVSPAAEIFSQFIFEHIHF